jgi:type II secretory pathway component PulF
MQATFFLSSTAAMMRSGIPLKTVVTDMVPYASPWLRTHLSKMLRGLEQGKSEVEVLGGGVLPEDSAARLQVYELMPDFSGIMNRLSEDNFVAYEDAVERIGGALKTFTFILLVTFAAVTLFAMFDWSNAFQTAIKAMRNGG